MTIVRVVVGGLVIALCAGFIPVGGCAKGCSQAGRVGASHADDFARIGTRGATHYGDDIARGTSRYGDDIARGTSRYGDDIARGTSRYGDDIARGAGRPPVVVGGVGHAGEDLAHLSRTQLESSVAALPEANGAVTALGRRPTATGTHLDLDDAGRTFGKDYARSIDDLAVSEAQHEKLMEAFETVQDVLDPVMELLDTDDEARAQERIQLVALELEARLAEVLTPQQLRKFRAQFGSSEVVAYRLGKDRPVQRRSDKVAP